MSTTAIIVAAGMGRRLAPFTDDRPKCMVEVNGVSILERQIAAYRAAGVTDIAVVRGYLGERIRVPGLRYFENPDYQRNNILASLFHAEPAMADGFLFSYADIVFRRDTVQRLCAEAGDYALVVDRRWRDAYEGRDQHPVAEAELCRVEAGRVCAVGKRKMSPEAAFGEFIGLAHFSARAAGRMRDEYRRLEREIGPHAPFESAPRFEVAYLTDLLNHLIALGETVVPLPIDGGWREIDTTQDLERAKAVVDW